jgi:signal transduction histidine kinase
MDTPRLTSPPVAMHKVDARRYYIHSVLKGSMPAILVLAIALFAAAPLRAQSSTTMQGPVSVAKGVLILSEGPVLPYGLVLREHLVAALRHDSAEPLNIYEELIDRIRFDNDEYDRQLVTFYKAKYINAPLDLVMTITEPALDFALRHRDELFPRAALLFGAVDERAIRGRNVGANTTGVFSHYDARATVEAALTLHRDTRHIVVVGGASRLDRGYLEVAREDLQGLASPADITYIADKPLNEVLAAVAALPDDSVVLFLSMQSDGHGVARTGPEVLAALRGAAKVPIYGMSGNFLGRGIVGGMLFDMQSHGKDLAQRARQILSGVQAADILPRRSPNSLTFDWRELKRFGIEGTRLPAGAAVVNREVSLWEAYKTTILMVAAVLAGQFLLIGGLLVQGRRRRRAELAIRDLSGRLLSAQEDERRRIARELHDNLSQQMALLAIGIEEVAMRPGHSPAKVARSMRELHQRTSDISTEIHNLAHRLHSSKLEALGLAAALRGHCQELVAQGVHVKFHDENVPRALPHEVELCLFRIGQEGLSNVVKHSGTRDAQVTLRATGDVLLLSVADSGRGFDEAAVAGQEGLGLASMRERLRLIEGEFAVRSQPGQGTTIIASVPIPTAGRKATADTVRVA